MEIRASLLALILRFWLPLLLVCAYAIRKGGAPERVVAWMLLAAAFATLAVRTDFAQRYAAVQLPVVLIDVALLSGLLVVAAKADRRWPILLSALHSVTLLGHLGKVLNPDLWRLGYAFMIALPTLPGLLVLAIGSWRHRIRVRRDGTDRSWSV